MADSKKFVTGSFLSDHNWTQLNDISFEPIGTRKLTGTVAPSNWKVDPSNIIQPWGFHQGGIINPEDFSSNGITARPDRYAEIPCLYCNEQISIGVQYLPCWSVYCAKCKQRFMVHMKSCDPECERRLDCLGVGIFVDLQKYPIIDRTLLRTPESPNWIMRPDQIKVNVSYSIPSDLVILSYGTNKSESNSTVQNDWFKGDPFQLPNVLKR